MPGKLNGIIEDNVVVTLSLFLQELLLYIDTLCFIMCGRVEVSRIVGWLFPL